MLNDCKILLAETWKLACQWKYWILILVFFAISTVLWILPYDKSVLSHFLVAENSQAEDTARFISFWGDFQTGTCITVLTIFIIGKLRKKKYWKYVALACLFSAITAGMIGNVLCFSFGRPRPHIETKDGIYAFNPKPSFHSFPSGHSATAFGTALPLAIAYPPAGIPAIGVAASIAWARMSLNRHYPSDIFAGSFIGIVCGILFGFGERKVNRDTKRRL